MRAVDAKVEGKYRAEFPMYEKTIFKLSCGVLSM